MWDIHQHLLCMLGFETFLIFFGTIFKRKQKGNSYVKKHERDKNIYIKRYTW